MIKHNCEHEINMQIWFLQKILFFLIFSFIILSQKTYSIWFHYILKCKPFFGECDLCSKNSGGVKKKPMIILEEFFFFVLVSTSGASNWQACKDSHWNNRTTFVFHKIVIYNSWTWKQSEDSLKISLTAKCSEFTDVQKLFLLWREI